MLAAYGGHEDVVAALIIAGADVTGLENNKGQKAEDLVGISSVMRDCLRRWQSFIERKQLEELERAIEKAAAAGRREDDYIAFLGSGLEHALVRQETALLNFSTPIQTILLCLTAISFPLQYMDYKDMLSRIRAVRDRPPEAQLFTDCAALRSRILGHMDVLVDEMKFMTVEKCDLTLKMLDDELRKMRRKFS